MDLINAQIAHGSQRRLAILLGEMGLGDALDSVPTQARQLRHIAQGHHSTQAINKAAQRFGVVRVGRAKGGAISKMWWQRLHWHRGTPTSK